VAFLFARPARFGTRDAGGRPPERPSKPAPWPGRSIDDVRGKWTGRHRPTADGVAGPGFDAATSRKTGQTSRGASGILDPAVSGSGWGGPLPPPVAWFAPVVRPTMRARRERPRPGGASSPRAEGSYRGPGPGADAHGPAREMPTRRRQANNVRSPGSKGAKQGGEPTGSSSKVLDRVRRSLTRDLGATRTTGSLLEASPELLPGSTARSSSPRGQRPRHQPFTRGGPQGRGTGPPGGRDVRDIRVSHQKKSMACVDLKNGFRRGLVGVDGLELTHEWAIVLLCSGPGPRGGGQVGPTRLGGGPGKKCAGKPGRGEAQQPCSTMPWRGVGNGGPPLSGVIRGSVRRGRLEARGERGRRDARAFRRPDLSLRARHGSQEPNRRLRKVEPEGERTMRPGSPFEKRLSRTGTLFSILVFPEAARQELSPSQRIGASTGRGRPRWPSSTDVETVPQGEVPQGQVRPRRLRTRSRRSPVPGGASPPRGIPPAGSGDDAGRRADTRNQNDTDRNGAVSS